MKKVFFLLSAMALVFAACSSEDTDAPVVNEKVNISLSADILLARTIITEDPDKNVGVSAWKEGDKVDLFLSSSAGTWSKADATLEYKNGQFTGTITPGTYDYVSIVYPAGMTVNNGSKVLYDPTPDGALPMQRKADPTAHIQECFWGKVANVTIADGTELNATMQRKSSVLKITLENNIYNKDFPTSTYTKLEMWVQDNIYNSYIDIINGAVTKGGKGERKVLLSLEDYQRFKDVTDIYIPLAYDFYEGSVSYFRITGYRSNGNTEWKWSKDYPTDGFAGDGRWINLKQNVSDFTYDSGGNELPPVSPFG